MLPAFIVLLSAPLTTPAAPTPPADVKPPAAVSVGASGWFQPGLTLQAWHVGGFPGGHLEDYGSTFRVRRAELYARGAILPGSVAYLVMVDAARLLEFQERAVPVGAGMDTVTVRQPVSPTSMLQDAFITFQSAYADVSVGQFKIPVSWEGYNSSARLLLPERAFSSREYGDRRDLGVRVAKTFLHGAYVAGVWNGSGSNSVDQDRAKDVGLRLELYPAAGWLVGGVVYRSVGQRRNPGTKDRYEADLRFERGRLLLQAELIDARDAAATGTVHAHGFYGAVGFSVAPAWQLAARAGRLDPDLGQDLHPAATPAARDELWHYDAGVNWLLHGPEAKLALSYSRVQYDERAAANDLVLAAQVAY